MDWLEEIKEYKQAFIEDLRNLIKIPSLYDEATVEQMAPFGKPCKEALNFMLDLGKKEGFQVQNIDGYAGVISYGDGKESVGVLGHLDIVPIGDGWTKDPLGGEIVNNYMFGRGTLDDKGPDMAAFYALKMLRDSGVKLNKKIMLIYGCDEESGMRCMDYYVKHAEVPDLGFVPDADFPVIYGEKGGLHVSLEGSTNTVITSMHAGERANIVIGKANARVAAWKPEYEALFEFYLKTNALQGSINILEDGVELFMEGVYAHAAWVYNGVNAALHLLNFIGKTYDDKFANDTYAMLSDWKGSALGIQMEGAYMGFLTMSLGILNIEYGKADMLIDIRYPNDADVAHIEMGFKNKIKALSYDLDMIIKKDAKPLFVDPNSTLVKTLTDVYRSYSLDEVTPNMTIGGGTYARKFPNFVAFGPEFPNRKKPLDMFVGGPHEKDEGVNVDDLLLAGAIYSAAMEELAK